MDRTIAESINLLMNGCEKNISESDVLRREKSKVKSKVKFQIKSKFKSKVESKVKSKVESKVKSKVESKAQFNGRTGFKGRTGLEKNDQPKKFAPQIFLVTALEVTVPAKFCLHLLGTSNDS